MNDDSLPQRALAVLDAALDMPVTDRDRWIAEHCAGDIALEDEARLLLSAAGNTHGILDVPPLAILSSRENLSIVAALAGRYEIVREIGRGGMATVFLAHEVKHNRDVVLKVLSSQVARLCGDERFHREVHIAATLSHPHIVPLIDSGEADGFLYYVMPWMDGRSLREVLKADRLPLSGALQILHDVASALQFAHSARVIHRDVKPENILIASGHAYLLDFGIAKLGVEPTDAAGITAPGFALGTRRYMAPEQVYAADTVDARADIFAWGALGAELLTGAPLPGGEPQLAARSVFDRRTDLPEHVVALLLECLATAPSQRPDNMSSVIAQFTSARARPRREGNWRSASGIAAGVAVVVAVSIVSWAAAQASTAPAFGDPVAVTVLRNETGDPALSVLGRFAGDWVTDGLQQLGVSKTVPWAGALLASEHASSTGAPLVATLREETLAGTVVTGSYYRVRDSLHLQAQLIDTRSGDLVSRLAPIVVPISHPEAAVMQLRDRVMGAVAAAHNEHVAAIPGLTRNPPTFAAYEAFNRGMDLFLSQKYSVALAEFRDAYALDSTFSWAATWGARAALNIDSLEAAGALSRRARDGGPELGAYHDASLRYIEARLLGDGTSARAAIQRAATLAPNSRAGFDNAVALLSAGSVRAAREQLQRMNPNRGEMRGWSSYWTQRVHTSHLTGDHAMALTDAREMARRYPERRVALVLQARALAATGNTVALDSAVTAWEVLPVNVYWSQGAAMVVAAEELMRRGHNAAGRRYAARAITWLTARLSENPRDRSHRYWMGSVLYDVARYESARPYFESLAREFPGEIDYRGLAAVVAARRKDQRSAERWLGPAAPTEIGKHLVFCARIAAINGRTEQSLTLLTSAMEHGIENYPWLSGAAFRDLAVLERQPRGLALLGAH